MNKHENNKTPLTHEEQKAFSDIASQLGDVATSDNVKALLERDEINQSAEQELGSAEHRRLQLLDIQAEQTSKLKEAGTLERAHEVATHPGQRLFSRKLPLDVPYRTAVYRSVDRDENNQNPLSTVGIRFSYDLPIHGDQKLPETRSVDVPVYAAMKEQEHSMPAEGFTEADVALVSGLEQQLEDAQQELALASDLTRLRG